MGQMGHDACCSGGQGEAEEGKARLGWQQGSALSIMNERTELNLFQPHLFPCVLLTSSRNQEVGLLSLCAAGFASFGS